MFLQLRQTGRVVRQTGALVDGFPAEFVKPFPLPRRSPAVQDNSGDAYLGKPLQAAHRLPSHGVIPGKFPGYIVELGSAVNVIDHRIFSIR